MSKSSLPTHNNLKGVSMFKKKFSRIRRLWFSERGQGSAEFGTILAGLLVAVLIVIAVFRDALIALFQRVAGLMSGG
jgi:Flp pilus assembly pilin Flp